MRCATATPARVAALALLLPLAGCGGGDKGRVARANPPFDSTSSVAPGLRIADDSAPASFPLVPIPPTPLGPTASRTPALAPVSAPTPPTPAAPVSAAAVVPVSAPTDAAAPAGDVIRDLCRRAAESYAGIDSYVACMTRRENVGGTDKPEEIMTFKFRKEPWSVYFKWLGDTGKGREVTYTKGRYNGEMHILLAAGDNFMKPAGSRFDIAPDSVLVRASSRHPITEAGIGASVERLSQLLSGRDHGDTSHGRLQDAGIQKRAEFAEPVPSLVQIIPARAETALPLGGRRFYYFDPKTHLPVLIVTQDDKGHEVEYYRYDKIIVNYKLDDSDFDPDRLWPKTAKGR
jgi:hypothetical protein